MLTKTLKADLKLKDGTIYPKGESISLAWDTNGSATATIGNRVFRVSASGLAKCVKGISKPSIATLERWNDEGYCLTVTGQRTEPDGYGTDGSPSWLIALGMI